MGTRSLITFMDHGKPLVTIYRQFDGYLEGRGRELASFLKDMTVINGFGDEKAGTHANGIGCLAAQWIKQEKEDIGGVYIHPPLAEPEPDDVFIEFFYRVSVDDDDKITVEILVGAKFKGTTESFFKRVNKGGTA